MSSLTESYQIGRLHQRIFKFCFNCDILHLNIQTLLSLGDFENTLVQSAFNLIRLFCQNMCAYIEPLFILQVTTKVKFNFCNII